MRKLVLPLLGVGLVLLAASGVRAADDDVKAIIEKAIKAHGGKDNLDKAAKNPAAQTKGKGTVELGASIPFTEEATIQPGRFKSTVELEANGMTIKIITVFNGEKAWVNANGKTTELEGKVLEELKETMYLMRFARFSFLNDKAFELSSLGEIKIDKRPAVGVKVASKGHKDVNLYFDKETGLLAKMERQAYDARGDKEVNEERIITEYQTVDGIKMAKKLTINHDGNKHVEAEVLEIKHREKFDDSEFGKP